MILAQVDVEDAAIPMGILMFRMDRLEASLEARSGRGRGTVSGGALVQGAGFSPVGGARTIAGLALHLWKTPSPQAGNSFSQSCDDVVGHVQSTIIRDAVSIGSSRGYHMLPLARHEC